LTKLTPGNKNDILSFLFPGVTMKKKFNFSAERKKTGFSIREISEIVGKTERTVYRWENGESHPDKLTQDTILRLREEQRDYSTNEIFTFIDLFAGIGGIRKAFEGIGGKCIFTSEWDKFCQITYKANFHDSHGIHGDITKIENNEIPKHDVLLAGFPCQPFSIAGVSKKNSLGKVHGFLDETQGTLFFNVAKIIQHHKPKMFFLENVKNLINHDKGNTFAIIKNVLENDLNYHIEYGIIDAKYFVPQHRERLYIIGFQTDFGFRFSDLFENISTEPKKLKSILHEHNTVSEALYTDNNGLPLSKYTLSPKLWNYLQDYARKHKEKGNGFGYGLFGANDIARTLSARYYKDGSEILIEQTGPLPRRLTPRECSRLMGFDDDRKSFKITVSDTQAYKQFGNSVVVPVIRYICDKIKPYLLLALKKTA
jgi:DNA (cytosine-5)-methyltransferase 1